MSLSISVSPSASPYSVSEASHEDLALLEIDTKPYWWEAVLMSEGKTISRMAPPEKAGYITTLLTRWQEETLKPFDSPFRDELIHRVEGCKGSLVTLISDENIFDFLKEKMALLDVPEDNEGVCKKIIFEWRLFLRAISYSVLELFLADS